MSTLCAGCGREVTRDEIGITKKLINRGASEYYCVSCLAGHFRVPEELILQKIRQFREEGCTLFQ